MRPAFGGGYVKQGIAPSVVFCMRRSIQHILCWGIKPGFNSPQDDNDCCWKPPLEMPGSSSVTFEAGSVEPSSPASASLSQSWRSSHRRLQEDSSSSSSTIVVANVGFNFNGRPSSAVEAGVTQILVTSSSTGAVGFWARATLGHLQ